MYNKLSKYINFRQFDSHKAFEIPIDPRRREAYFHLNKILSVGNGGNNILLRIKKMTNHYFLKLFFKIAI